MHLGATTFSASAAPLGFSIPPHTHFTVTSLTAFRINNYHEVLFRNKIKNLAYLAFHGALAISQRSPLQSLNIIQHITIVIIQVRCIMDTPAIHEVYAPMTTSTCRVGTHSFIPTCACFLRSASAIAGSALDAYSESIIVFTPMTLPSLKLHMEIYSFSYAVPAIVWPSVRIYTNSYQSLEDYRD